MASNFKRSLCASMKESSCFVEIKICHREMNFDHIDHNTTVDLKEADMMGRRSDIGLLVISFIYLINLVISVIYVWFNTYTTDSILINSLILVENIVLMVVVVFAFNKYKL
ncbi:hypothetical protein PAEPH01_1661 [Pancytospora epiphaga]|nr:hypothetical protein PAEPH01_1661 [Pancytospora epiphaga]